MVLGVESGTVVLVPHHSEWAALFHEEQRRLRGAIGAHVVDIQHVGSTSIPSVPAKPILDIGIAVENFERAASCVHPMQELGYTYKGEDGIPRRHYFVKGRPRTHHAHMVEVSSFEWLALVLFRDHVLAHPDVAQAYASLKTELASRFAGDRKAYQHAKAEFIRDVIAKAKEERSS